MKPGDLVASRYRVDARLGAGGSGEVWRATDATTGRAIAIKLLHAQEAGSPSARQRFAREARISAIIHHPNVIEVLDDGQHEESLFLAMELLDGVSLADAFHLSPPLSVQDLLVVMHDAASALAAAHDAGVVHRDVKPANVFLHCAPEDGLASAKVLDFGISKLADGIGPTRTGAFLGSPQYMSPEQIRAPADADQRADVWSCGVVLFEGLTGTCPHDGHTLAGLVAAIITKPPASIDHLAPGLPEPVRAVVRDCLAPLPARIQSAGELAGRLADVLLDPTLAERPLARPLSPPSEPILASRGVRVRPPRVSDAPDGMLTLALPTRALPTLALPAPPDGDDFATVPLSAAVVAAARAQIANSSPPPAFEPGGTLLMPKGMSTPSPFFAPQAAAGAVPRSEPPSAPPAPAPPRPAGKLGLVIAAISVLLIVALLALVLVARR